jgi:hypothetical protein
MGITPEQFEAWLDSLDGVRPKPKPKPKWPILVCRDGVICANITVVVSEVDPNCWRRKHCPTTIVVGRSIVDSLIEDAIRNGELRRVR